MGEYVEARGADEIYWGCFRRGPEVFRSGFDLGCPRPNPRVVRTSIPPNLPIEIPGDPRQVGTCWDPVRQPIAAKRLFRGCFALDADGVLFDLRILRPPVEVARDVRLAGPLLDHRLLIIHEDGFATIQAGRGGLTRAPPADPLPAGPPQPVDLPPVRALFPTGVILEDGAAAMFWSDEQLLRPLGGFTEPVEIAAVLDDHICVRTAAREVFCAFGLAPRERREPDATPLVLAPAVFDQEPPDAGAADGKTP